MRTLAPLFSLPLFSLLLATPALALESEAFSDASRVNLAVLTSTIAASPMAVEFAPVAVLPAGGQNTLQNAFNGSVGVFSVVQNSGTGSNVQQSVQVQIGQLTLPALPTAQ